MQELGDNQACAAQGCVAARDGRGHNSDDGQRPTEHSEPSARHRGDNLRRLQCGRNTKLGGRPSVEEIRRHGSPDERHNALGYHRPVEQGPPLTLALHAPCHERTLRSVEAADSSAGYGDEQAGEDCARLRTHVGKTVGQFRQRRPLDKQHNHQRDGHEQHGDGEERVYLADDFVDWQHRCEEVIDEDYNAPGIHPGERIAAKVAEDERRTVHEHSPDHEQEEHREYEHHLLCAPSKVSAYQLGQARSAVADRQHAAQIVVNGTGEDAPQDNPQVGRRAELRAHDGAEDGTRARDVEELNHKNLPSGKNDVVYAVGHTYRRSGPAVGSEDALNHPAVDEIAHNEGYQTDDECYHLQRF